MPEHADDGPEPDVPDPVSPPEEEIARLKQDNALWRDKYDSLVEKVANIRANVGDKLKQDADELDRRAQEIEELRAANASLSYTTDAIRQELESLNQDNASLTAELSSLRSRASFENTETETTLREALSDIERLRTRNEELELQVSQERLERDGSEASYAATEQELRAARTELARTQQELQTQQTSTANLASVLEEFQASKDRELQSALADLQEQLHTCQGSLAEYKKRAHDAECQLQESSSNSSQLQALQKELKDKTVLIGKLRHEAVLASEHLTEALRRLRNSSNDTSVDRRLVNNVLLRFLTTPRGDSKRFEMLKLLSTILQWSDEERERAGLQRSSSSSSNSLSPPSSTSGRRSRNTPTETDTNESFSNLWVEYLLRESTANATSPPPSSMGSILPPLSLGSLTRISASGSSIAPSSAPSIASTRRPSFGSVSSTGPSSVVSAADAKKPANGS